MTFINIAISKKPSTKKNKSYVGCKKGINPLNTIKAFFIWQILLFVEQINETKIYFSQYIISLIIKLISVKRNFEILSIIFSKITSLSINQYLMVNIRLANFKRFNELLKSRIHYTFISYTKYKLTSKSYSLNFIYVPDQLHI